MNRFVEANGIRIHITEDGEGPLVLLLHGFLNFSYSWRHQLRGLADAGYHVVAPDLRGYGRTDRPEGAAHYTQLHLAGDVVGLIDALGERQAVVVGHDWGAMVAWTAALLRPDRVRAVAGISIPYIPRGDRSLLTAMRDRFGDGYYIQYFQHPGVADAELARDPHATFRGVFHSGSGAATAPWNPVIKPGDGWLHAHPDPGTVPPWLTATDLEAYATTFAGTGFTGGLNYYRALDLSWELLAPWHDAKVTVPAMFLYGDRDSFALYARNLIEALPDAVPGLRATIALPGCGHWLQQERPEEATKLLANFLNDLGSRQRREA